MRTYLETYLQEIIYLVVVLVIFVDVDELLSILPESKGLDLLDTCYQSPKFWELLCAYQLCPRDNLRLEKTDQQLDIGKVWFFLLDDLEIVDSLLEISNGILEIPLYEVGSAYLIENLCGMDIEILTFLDFALDIRDNGKLLVVFGTLDTVIWNFLVDMSIF